MAISTDKNIDNTNNLMFSLIEKQMVLLRMKAILHMMKGFEITFNCFSEPLVSYHENGSESHFINIENWKCFTTLETHFVNPYFLCYNNFFLTSSFLSLPENTKYMYILPSLALPGVLKMGVCPANVL